MDWRLFGILIVAIVSCLVALYQGQIRHRKQITRLYERLNICHGALWAISGIFPSLTANRDDLWQIVMEMHKIAKQADDILNTLQED